MSQQLNIVSLRHSLFEHPEVSGTECGTRATIRQVLSSLHPAWIKESAEGYGLFACWHTTACDNPAEVATLVFRADIDALPIGHRCGHDGHTAIMLRFAQLVFECSDLKYNVILMFQPEEETGLGARKMLDSGVLQQYRVAAVFGLHNIPGYPLGTVVLNRHTFAAASTGLIYRLIGRETHASTPEKGLNPGLAVAEIIQHFAALNGTTQGPDFQQSTLICSRIGEESFGTSAGKAEVMFTLRAFSNKAMENLTDKADGIVKEVSERCGLQFSREYREPFRATENDTAYVAQLEALAMKSGVPFVLRDEPFRWSEDFAEYLMAYRGAFFGIGSGERQHELHHPDYVFPDGLIEPAARFFELIMNNIAL